MILLNRSTFLAAIRESRSTKGMNAASILSRIVCADMLSRITGVSNSAVSRG